MTKEIICKNGEVCLVDDEDYPLLSRFTWYVVGSERKPYPGCFVYGRGKARKHIFMHQMIMGGIYGIDHRDNNGFNNQKENLRAATSQQNGWNRGVNKNGQKYKGVASYLNKDGEVRYKVQIKLSAKGVVPANVLCKRGFITDVEAAIFYNEQVKKHRGKWAWLNPIPENSGIVINQ